MNLDLKAMQEGAERERAEAKARYIEERAKETAELERDKAEMDSMLQNLVSKRNEQRLKEMEAEQAKAARESAEKIRAEYAKQYPGMDDSPSAKAMREMLNKMKAE